MIYVPLDRKKDQNVYNARETDSKTGAYTINNIPAGSYRVSIQQMDTFPTHDMLNFKFSLKDSPILRDVTRDNDVIDIDLQEYLAKQ